MSTGRRRVVVRVSIAVSFAVLAAEVLLPGFRHRSPGGGVAVCVITALGILGGLAYLRNTRGGR